MLKSDIVWTKEKLRALKPEELRNVAVNVARRTDEAALQVMQMIEEVGLPPEVSSFRLDSPLGKKMQSVIFSAEGKAAAIKAAQQGRAPMEAIDRMLQSALGSAYSSEDEGTIQAGYLVANLMKQNHWAVSGKRGKLPADCVAKTAALYVHIPSKRA
jgi:hypothetical protein